MEEVESSSTSINRLLRFLSLKGRSSLLCSPSGLQWKYGYNGRGWLTGPFPSLALLSTLFILQ